MKQQKKPAQLQLEVLELLSEVPQTTTEVWMKQDPDDPGVLAALTALSRRGLARELRRGWVALPKKEDTGALPS